MFSLFVVAIFFISGLKIEVISLAKAPSISWLLASISCRNAAWLFVVKWGIWVEKLVLHALRPTELTFGENVALLVEVWVWNSICTIWSPFESRICALTKQIVC